MTERRTTPTGLTRRGRRLSDRQTRERMLHAATTMIERTGLTVSLDHISFEEVIREADVARSTAYRHWPHKDLFFGDLVKDLATRASPEIIRDEVRLIRQILTEHRDRLDTPPARHSLLIELIRRLSLLDFQAILASPGWRTYLALHATVPSLADPDLREQVRAGLARAEADRTARIALAWRQLATLFGYRLRPELDTDFDTLATLVSATMRGLVVTAQSTPRVADHRTTARPFGAEAEQEWSLAALGLVSIAMAFLEPDPVVTWSADHLTEVHRVLDAWEDGEPGGT